MNLTDLFFLARRYGRGQIIVFTDLPLACSLFWRQHGDHVNRDGLLQGHFFLWGHSAG